MSIKMDSMVARIGDIKYDDYANTYRKNIKAHLPPGTAEKRRELYAIRHSSDRINKGTPGYYAYEIYGNEKSNQLDLFGILGYKVWDQVKGDVSKLQDWEYEITNFYINKLTATQIQGTIVWNFINKSSQAGGIKDVQVDVLYQDRLLDLFQRLGNFNSW
jgi:hypothetical protein